MKRYIYVLALILLGMNLNAQSVWDGKREAIKKGSGTEADPYLIENAQNLAWLAYLINYDYGKWTEGKYFLLTTDIDLNGSENNQWIPIGAGSSLDKYKNINIYFDGDNHSITGLYIDNNAEIANKSSIWCYGPAALFNKISQGNDVVGYIKNLYVEGSIHVDDLECGGIVGENLSIIENCVSNVNIETNNSAGGIAVKGNGIIKNCYNIGDITGENSAGGILGTYPAKEILNCYNTGNITGGYTGGIAGATTNTSVTNCYNTGNVTGNGETGGIIGLCAKGKVTNCYNVGTVKTSSEYIGAIIGKKQSNAKIENSHYLNTCIESSNEYGEAQNADFMRSQEFVNMLNNNTDVWSMDNDNINNGYPILSPITFVVGVEEFVDKNNMVSIFPNPANDYVNIEGDIAYYQIFDIIGNVIATNDMSEDVKTINVSDYTPGIYFVRCITQNGGIITKKVVIR